MSDARLRELEHAAQRGDPHAEALAAAERERGQRGPFPLMLLRQEAQWRARVLLDQYVSYLFRHNAYRDVASGVIVDPLVFLGRDEPLWPLSAFRHNAYRVNTVIASTPMRSPSYFEALLRNAVPQSREEVRFVPWHLLSDEQQQGPDQGHVWPL